MIDKNNFILGTAQLGQTYGLRKSNQLNNHKEGIKFINDAIQLGVNNIDTASIYGDSEKIIGKRDTKNSINIFTKIPKLKYSSIEEVSSYFNQSIKNLNVAYISGLLMHHYKDVNISNLDCYIEKLIINKKIEKFGVSIYEENNIQHKNYINLMQLPANIFKQDLLRSKSISKFIRNGGTIHIRSIFIQGLILMNDKFISKKFHDLSEPIKKFKNLAKHNDVLPEELAIAVVKELCPLGIPVIGCDNLNQLKKLISIMSRNIDSKLIYKAIDLGKKYPSKLWDPRFW